MSKTGDHSWGHLAATEHFGRETKNYVPLEQSDFHKPPYRDCTQAAHCLFYARSKEKIFGIYDSRLIVLMQMRFDGYLGFPGGGVDSGEDLVAGLNRELVEEMNVDVLRHGARPCDWLVSHYCPDSALCLHLYARELPLADLQLVEAAAVTAHDFGSEVLGTVRVPLYTMGDGYRGFPAFISNVFAGNAREQLFCALKKLGAMTSEEISAAISARPAPALVGTPAEAE